VWGLRLRIIWLSRIEEKRREIDIGSGLGCNED
jgi:hypothetical protein